MEDIFPARRVTFGQRSRREGLEFGGRHLFVRKREAGHLRQHGHEDGVLIALARHPQPGAGRVGRRSCLQQRLRELAARVVDECVAEENNAIAVAQFERGGLCGGGERRSEKQGTQQRAEQWLKD
jgi:hypothetical protein